MEKRECTIGYFEWDTPQLIRFTLTKGEPNIDDIDEFTKLSMEVYEKMGDKFVAIFDATHGQWLSGEGRIKWGKDTKMVEAKFADRLVRNYMVIPNNIIKMMLKGVNLISKPKIPQVLFETTDKAMEAAEKEVAGW